MSEIKTAERDAVPCVVLTPEERAAFERFHETWEDNEGYDGPKEMMRRLADEAGRYDITKFGHYVLAAGAAPVPDGYRLVSIAQLNTWGVYDEETAHQDLYAAAVRADNGGQP